MLFVAMSKADRPLNCVSGSQLYSSNSSIICLRIFEILNEVLTYKLIWRETIKLLPEVSLDEEHSCKKCVPPETRFRGKTGKIKEAMHCIRDLINYINFTLCVIF